MLPIWVPVKWTARGIMPVVTFEVMFTDGVRFLNTVTHSERFSQDVTSQLVPFESVAEWLML
jgi:hypothetical protein